MLANSPDTAENTKTKTRKHENSGKYGKRDARTAQIWSIFTILANLDEYARGGSSKDLRLQLRSGEFLTPNPLTSMTR
eukprot:4991054-Pyramimonas_sp.AAC.1